MTDPRTGAPRSALHELTLTRFRLFFREPSALFWTFGFPVLLSIALGIAFRNKPPEALHVAIESSPAAERTLSEIEASGGKEVAARIEDADAARRDLRAGKVVLVVTADARRTYRYDETHPAGRLARRVVDDVLQRAEGRVDPTPVADERVTEPGARYIDFLVPGLVGVNLMSSSMWGIGYVIVEMRTKRLVKRMLATPMRKTDFLVSFVLMRALFVLIEVPVLFGFGALAFGVHIAGSVALILALCTVGALAFAGLGLLIASRAENTQTVGGLMNLVMMPMFVCSGVFFSTSNFPDAVQPYLRALPLTMLNDALRAVTNEGAGLARPLVTWAIVVLFAWALVSFGTALKIFRWR
ncbi:MAG: ABC transporter permease [Polyangiaceae bacterium]